jgi:transposase
MEDCEITFEGASTIHDFPERLIAVIKLKPGRPRDKAEIESMFNTGRGRFYVQPDDVADINKTIDVSAYGNKDTGAPTKDSFVNVFRKLSNG